MTNHLHKGDLPAYLRFDCDIAVDTEAMGLNNKRDRLCVVQLSDGKGDAHLVQFAQGAYKAPNLIKLSIRNAPKFSISRGSIYPSCGIIWASAFRLCIVRARRRGSCAPIPTSMASKDICKELLGVDISKQQQTSDWGTAKLTQEQVDYAAADVLYLHRCKAKLDEMIARENRVELAQACFDFLPYRAELDLAGWENEDIFAHS